MVSKLCQPCIAYCVRVSGIIEAVSNFLTIALYVAGQAQDYGNGVYQPPLKCANTMRLLNNVTAR